MRGNFGSEISLDSTLRLGVVKSSQTSPSYAGSYAGPIDTTFSSTATYIGGDWFRPYLMVDLNLPTGESFLRQTNTRAKMDPDYVEVSSFGQGFDIGATLGSSLTLSDQWSIDLSVKHMRPGAYKLDGPIIVATGEQPTLRSQPGSSLSTAAGLMFSQAPYDASLKATLTQSSVSYNDGVPSVRGGDSLNISALLMAALSDDWSLSVTSNLTISKKNQVLDSKFNNFLVESANANSTLFKTEVYLAQKWDGWSAGPVASITKRNANQFDPRTYNFVPAKTMGAVGMRVKREHDETTTFNFDAQYFRARENPSPEKVADGIVIQDSALPALHHSGFKILSSIMKTF
jgi:hypothetical protein